MNSLLDAIDNGPGYAVLDILSIINLSAIRNIVQKHFFCQYPLPLHNVNPANFPLDSYHNFQSHFDHSSFWYKAKRVLPKYLLNEFMSIFPFTEFLSKQPFFITDEDSLGYGNVYWRLVRPQQPSDVGPLHRDEWFWVLNPSFEMPHNTSRRIKVWLPLYSNPELNGLLVEPFSQLRNDIKLTSEERHGIVKPCLIDSSKFNTMHVNAHPGQIVFFHDRLIHGGSLNLDSKTRVSLEFTIALAN